MQHLSCEQYSLCCLLIHGCLCLSYSTWHSLCCHSGSKISTEKLLGRKNASSRTYWLMTCQKVLNRFIKHQEIVLDFLKSRHQAQALIHDGITVQVAASSIKQGCHCFWTGHLFCSVAQTMASVGGVTEVRPKLYLGSRDAAINTKSLAILRISHILPLRLHWGAAGAGWTQWTIW